LTKSPCAEQPLGVGPMSLHDISVLRVKGTKPQVDQIALRGAATEKRSPRITLHSESACSKLFPLFPLFSLIAKIGGLVCSDLQTGHLLGVVKRLRFLKTKPQSRHSAGWAIMETLFPSDLCTWGRCSSASFSLIPSIREMSRVVTSVSLRI